MLFPLILEWILHYLRKNEVNPSHSTVFAIPGSTVQVTEENSCRVLNKGYVSVPCRKTTQVFIYEWKWSLPAHTLSNFKC